MAQGNDMDTDPQVQALRDLAIEDHRRYVAGIRERAAQAHEAGDLEREQRHLDRIARLEAKVPDWVRNAA